MDMEGAGGGEAPYRLGRIAPLTAAILFLGLTAAASATAADLNVPADYPTIQAAVNAAQTNDTIHIAPGVYTGQVLITNKTLTLIGQPGTILRASTNMSPLPALASAVVPIIGIRSSSVMVRGLIFEVWRGYSFARAAAPWRTARSTGSVRVLRVRKAPGPLLLSTLTTPMRSIFVWSEPRLQTTTGALWLVAAF